MNVKELIGVTLGTCTIERVIGRGGMGAVYLAQQSRPVRTVALKVLLPATENDPEQQRIFLERFRREADTVAKLEHKNILPIYEYSEAEVDGQRLAYLVMPYIRGGTLRDRIDEMKRNGAQFDLKLVASYISQIADALSYAHSLGVVHRDIKPGNLLFHQDGRLLLSDFGIVRLTTLPSLTTVGSFIGTAEYASPEQISSSEVDFRSDIYSLGIILYELLTGSVPFTGSNPFAVMTKQLNDPVPPMSNIRSGLPPAFQNVVNKALAKNPEDRYQSATAMAADLCAAVAVPATPPLRITGNANNDELTFAERPPIVGVGVPFVVPLTPGADAQGGFSPTQPVYPVRPPGVVSLPPWQRVPQKQDQAQSAVGIDQTEPTTGPGAKVYRKGRRLIYYGVALIGLLLQFFVFLLLMNKEPGSLAQESAVLGILFGTGINMLILAAVGFTGVVRSRSISKYVYRCLAAVLVAPIVSGLFISFGTDVQNPRPILAYIVLLVSNIFAIRQLDLVDVAEQVEVVPILWRPALVGASTGLLPLTIILIFAFAAPSLLPPGQPSLFNLFWILFVALIGAPTPGAMMAVWLSQKMTFAVLSRSSALAGLLMFLGAFVLVVLWNLLFTRTLQPLLVLLLWISILGLIGALRGMLDTWVYQHVVRRNK